MKEQQKGEASLQRETRLPKEVIAMMKVMGIDIPSDIKEIDTPVVSSNETRQIILPVGMSKLTAAEELRKQYENEEQKIDQIATFEGWDWKDALVAIKTVTEQIFGWMNSKPTWYQQPTEIDVVVDIIKGVKQTVKAYHGIFEITTWSNARCEVGVDRRGTVSIVISAKRKYAKEVTQYFNEIRQHLENNSIYRGRTIVVTGTKERLDFEIIENKGSAKIVLNDDERLVIDNFVINALDEPGKRCYLFTGPYGNGKTETAMEVGRVGVEKHGMSFFYLKDASLFDVMLNTSKKYQPCIIFMEDIDEIAAGEKRDAEMNRILNTLDGVQTKGNSLITIFTTNHANRINPALRRPGRIDLIIKFENPNKAAAKKIYQTYFNPIEGAENLDYDKILEKTPDVQGAVLAEVCKRSSKLAEKEGAITTDIVLSSLASMKYQIELMAESVEQKDEDKIFVEKFQNIIVDGIWKSENGKALATYVENN